jgi:hypothetical protein
MGYTTNDMYNLSFAFDISNDAIKRGPHGFAMSILICFLNITIKYKL